jgi:hypothetical protein
MGHGGEFHFSSCLFLQNLGKSRKVCDPAGVFLMAGSLVGTNSTSRGDPQHLK